jgi:glycosyltransferase involved in cell wall biosynthesis
MLSQWAMHSGRLKKKLAWSAYQRRDLASATAFHATSQEEAAEIRDLGLEQPIAIIPNGIQPPKKVAKPDSNGHARALFLSRIHPKKGLLNLVRAWKAAQPPSEWELVIAGPDENGHRAEVESLVQRLDLQQQVKFVGEIDDDKKWDLYASAEVFVLPSFSENFGTCVVEALACGVPVITTTGAPWQDLPRLGFGWQSAATVEGVSDSLRQVIKMPKAELRARGAGAADWVRRSFSWDVAARQMISFYEWLQNEVSRPGFVQ